MKVRGGTLNKKDGKTKPKVLFSHLTTRATQVLDSLEVERDVMHDDLMQVVSEEKDFGVIVIFGSKWT